MSAFYGEEVTLAKKHFIIIVIIVTIILLRIIPNS